MAETPVVGYIIVKDQSNAAGKPEQEGVLALTRGGRKGPKWVRRPNLTECFVYTKRAVERAIRRNRWWVKEATSLALATYNPVTQYAEPTSLVVPLSKFAETVKPLKKSASA